MRQYLVVVASALSAGTINKLLYESSIFEPPVVVEEVAVEVPHVRRWEEPYDAAAARLEELRARVDDDLARYDAYIDMEWQALARRRAPRE